VIRGNTFVNSVAPQVDLRNTTDVLIDGNLFSRIGTGVSLRNSAHILLSGNSFADVARPVKSDSEGAGNLLDVDPERTSKSDPPLTPDPATIDGAGKPVLAPETPLDEYLQRFATLREFTPSAAAKLVRDGSGGDYERYLVPPLKGGKNAFLPPNTLRGQRYILVGEWGPYDFQRPILWPRGQSGSTQKFEILGPAGKWRALNLKGAKLSASSGVVPGQVEAEIPPGQAGTTEIQLEYVGGQTVDELGIASAAGKPVRFGFKRFFAPIEWDVRFFAWDKQSDPRTAASAFAKKLKAAPLAHVHKDKLDYAGYGAFEKGVPGAYFATVADGVVTLPPGAYRVELTTDDGARLSIDGKRVIDEWHYQGPTSYSATITGGTHRLHVDHFQIDGYSALKVSIVPAP
jgi:hypothetical protein